jgi:hypothetical protein
MIILGKFQFGGFLVVADPSDKNPPKKRGRKPGQKNAATKEAKIGIEMMCRVHSPAAVRSLAHIAVKGKTEAARVAASKELLDRGYGRPRQSIDLEGNLTTRDLTDAQLNERLAQLLRKA